MPGARRLTRSAGHSDQIWVKGTDPVRTYSMAE